ncbi:MAG: response regulator [Candidatus Riflebacteria bacterium]|nr:response regulator [Candidatus Riflebacteria bacterium]
MDNIENEQKRTRVLIVDDAEILRKILRDLLEKSGYEVFEAVNGKEAVMNYPKIKPDIITMDVTMPEMDGLTAVKAIRKLDSKVKIIMITALGTANTVKDAIIAGANNFIVKPYKANKVLTIIKKVLESK